MIQGAKAARQLSLLLSTPLQIVDLSAVIAAEVVMVGLAGLLISRRFTGQLNGCQPALLEHRLEIAIDGRDAQLSADLVGAGTIWISSKNFI